MRFFHSQSDCEADNDLSITSMIDVVFLLLIFFLVTASFIRPERNFDSAITFKKAAAGSSGSLGPTIVQVVRAENRCVYRVGENEWDRVDELAAFLLDMDNQTEGAFVQISDDAPFRMAATAIHACKSAGYREVAYVPFNLPDKD